MTLEEIFERRKSNGGLNSLLDIKNIRYDENGRFTVDMKVKDELLNPYGMAHGGTIFALCDTAAGSLIYLLEKKTVVTADSYINFYKPGRPGKILTAVVSERKRGKSSAVLLVEVYDDEKEHIADATLTMVYK